MLTLWRVSFSVTCGLMLLAVLTISSALPGAQDRGTAPPTAQSPPTFRSGVQLIEVDVFVTDKDGRFVHGLQRDDFEIVADDKPHDIQAFSFINLPTVTTASGAVIDPPEADITTNTMPARRVYVILMDSPSTGGPGGTRTGLTYDAYAKAFSRRFVEESVLTGDHVAVVHVQGTVTDAQPFTTSKRLMLASIDRYGRGLSGDTADLAAFELIRRNLDTYRTIQDLSERLGAISGLRKAILWVGGQLDYSPWDNCPRTGRGAGCERAAAAAILLAGYRDAIAAANRHNVAIYPIDPSGLTTELGAAELERKAALRMVAEDTGGYAVVGTNNLTDGYQAIVRDMSTYYVLGYVASVEHRDGKFHDIRVRVKRQGLNVRARKGYFAPRPDARAPVASVLPEGVSAAARAALRMPLPVRGLNLAVFSAAFKGSGKEGTVVIGGQIGGDLRLGTGDRIALSYQVFDVENRVQVGQYKVFTVNPLAENRTRTEEVGVRFVERLALPPGQYELRLVAEQTGGSLGSVVVPVTIPDFDEPLALSDVTLAASSAAADLTVQEDAVMRTAHGMSPTAIRRFPRGDIVSAFAEVYSNDSRTTAANLTMIGIVKDATGAEKQRAEASPVAAASAAPGRWGFTLEVGPLDLEPGQYVLTVEVTSSRRTDTVRRSMPFVVEN